MEFLTRPEELLGRRPPLVAVMAATLFLGSATQLLAAAYIRVNQVGYPTSATKRAYLMASGPETGAHFALKNSSGSTVYTGAIGTSLGTWGTFPDVYALDFDSVSSAGTYVISVSGPIAATSPSFKIDTAANLYLRPLANSLSF